jgi:hypothetical protein
MKLFIIRTVIEATIGLKILSFGHATTAMVREIKKRTFGVEMSHHI